MVKNSKNVVNIGVRPHKEKINISKEIINKTRGAEAPYAARMNHTPLRGGQQATIYYSLLSDKASDGEKAQQGLDKAKGLIRSELGSRLNIFKTPELTFKRDPSVAYGSRIDQLINQLHKQER